MRPFRFAALDFETASYERESACALSIVIGENDRIQTTWARLIRPPRPTFLFTYLHGISWEDVRDQMTFGELWPQINALLSGVDFLVAHNASFDRGVMNACCLHAGIPLLEKPYVCTVRVARAVWNLRPTKLSDVCTYLNIPLNHHNALSDAQACARILLAAKNQGHDYTLLLKKHSLRKVKQPVQ